MNDWNSLFRVDQSICRTDCCWMFIGTSFSPMFNLYATVFTKLFRDNSAMPWSKRKKKKWILNNLKRWIHLGLWTCSFTMWIIFYSIWFHLAWSSPLWSVSFKFRKCDLYGSEKEWRIVVKIDRQIIESTFIIEQSCSVGTVNDDFVIILLSMQYIVRLSCN